MPIPEWLARVEDEDALLAQLAELAAQARTRRARALADGAAQVGSHAAVGRLLTPQVTGQAVGAFITVHLTAPQDTTPDSAAVSGPPALQESRDGHP